MKSFISLLTLFLFFSCKNDEIVRDKKITIPNYEKLAQLDVPLGEIKDGDWLQQHLESGQTFEQYLSKKTGYCF